MVDQSVSYQTLLQQCAQGESDALQQLYEREGPYLNALGMSLLHRPNDAEELVRESFALIWRHAGAYDLALGSARAWIYSIFRFRAQLRLKQTPARSSFAKVKPRLLIPSNAPAELQQFQHLDEKARKMLALAYLHAYSYAEIAKECHSSIDLTQKHIHHSLLRLTRLFDKWESDSAEDRVLLGTYCLGLLRDSANTESAQNLLNDNRKAAQDLLRWEEIFSALTYSLNPQLPSPQLLGRIYHDLDLNPPAVTKTVIGADKSSVSNKPISASLTEIINNPSPKVSSRFDTPVTVTETSQQEKNKKIAHVATTSSGSAPTFATSSSTEKDKKSINASIDHNKQQNHVAPLTEETSKDVNSVTKTEQLETKSPWKKNYWLWLVLVALLASLAVWAFMPKAPTIQMVKMSPRTGAILQAPGQSSTPAWILSVDPEGHVLLTPQVRTELKADEVVQLWTQTPNSTEMRSLGLLNPNEPVTIPKELIGNVEVGQIFEMTLEPPTGSSVPTGPVLFIGRVVKFGDFTEDAKNSKA